MPTFRVVVADDDASVRAAVAALVETDPRLRVVSSVGDGAAAVRAAATHHPALAIVDVRMPGGGAATVAGILDASPQTVVVVCSSYDDDHVRATMRDAGARGFVVKGAADELVDVARAVLGLADVPEPHV